MKGLDPEHYGISLQEIGILIAHARRDHDKPELAIREHFMVSEEQALEWIKAAHNQGLVPDHNKMTRPR